MYSLGETDVSLSHACIKGTACDIYTYTNAGWMDTEKVFNKLGLPTVTHKVFI